MVVNIFIKIKNYLVEYFYLNNIEKLALSNFSFFELYSKSSAFAVDYIDRWKYVFTRIFFFYHYYFNKFFLDGSDIYSIGSVCSKAKPLEKELENFVSDPSSKGTIYIAFGTNVQWDFASDFMLNAFFDSLNHFKDYRIIFSFNGKKQKKTESHIKIVKWAPQFDILMHTKTRLFISHGGLKRYIKT